MSLDISKYSWYNYYNQGNRHPTTLKISFCPFLFFSFILSLLYSFLFIWVVRTLIVKPIFLTNFKVHSTVLSTAGTSLYSRALELIHLA